VTRIEPQPGELVDRGAPVSFTFDDKPVTGYTGDTIASALYAAGRRTFSRSFKYHRRRGLLCCSGACANCLVAVDGAPGVRACVEPVREGMRVTHQNATPSLEFDAMRVTDLAGGAFTPVGFYYKTFTRPRRAWPLYEKVLRSAAGLGRVPDRQEGREWRTQYRRRHADVLVVGGGAAGLHAAIAAAELGADTVLVDDGPRLGGRMLFEGLHERAAALARQAADAGVELIGRASGLGFYDGLVAVWQGDTLHQIRAARHVVATGTIEQPLVFEGNDLPGVLLSSGARRLLALYGVAPGARAVVAAVDERGLEAALALREAGVGIAAVVDLRAADGSNAARACAAAGIEVLTGATVVRAVGRGAVTGAELAQVDVDGSLRGGGRAVDCDLLVVSGGWAPATSLLSQAGASTRYVPERAHIGPDELPDGVLSAGDVAGDGKDQAASASGTLAGLEAAHALGLGDARSRARANDERHRLAEARRRRPRAVAPPPVCGDGGKRCFACLCEDVTVKDVRQSVAEGFDSLELAKRYTTVTMGPCQGRMCHLPSARLMARETSLSMAAVGSTTARPPWAAVPMGVLAGRPVDPAKRSALHGRHRELGANVHWAGDWRRAYDYGDPRGEALAVHEDAGLIDVSTLGKLIVRGPDAGDFLDRLYPNRLSNMRPGRIRYGVICSDAGRILDEGIICRLDDETFYVTTSSSGAGAVEEWFAWWLADWKLDVRMTDVAQGVAAMNLAGPRAREILSGLTDVDCSPEAFEYMDGKHAAVAGVPCLILRIGFVGELGYEIHCPAAQAEPLWDAIAAAGVRPFGLEPQRVLRLQKMHLLVGQDTDSESTPYGAAMPWIVQLDKEGDFVGRWALEHLGESEPQSALVGVTLDELPLEGAAVLDSDGAPAGRVTSVRQSAQLGTVIGLAWVPAALASDGSRVTVSDRGKRLEATVTTRPFYDPEGAVLRS
jgi:sarcosine oxidase, subunit alpha